MDGKKKGRTSTPFKILILMIVIGVLFIGLKLYCVFFEDHSWMNTVGYGLLFAEFPLFAILLIEMKK